ncbi:hypothetical protein G7046_g6514 [Stylonectria norvegica]|nr:hypothetical protein G7046_g6514 [Stylonectria norvegica]
MEMEDTDGGREWAGLGDWSAGLFLGHPIPSRIRSNPLRYPVAIQPSPAQPSPIQRKPISTGWALGAPSWPGRAGGLAGLLAWFAGLVCWPGVGAFKVVAAFPTGGESEARRGEAGDSSSVHLNAYERRADEHGMRQSTSTGKQALDPKREVGTSSTERASLGKGGNNSTWRQRRLGRNGDRPQSVRGHSMDIGRALAAKREEPLAK